MHSKHKMKSSEDLYDSGPTAWMFRPYYVAIKSKEDLATELLSSALEPHYMDQDSEAINKHFKTRNFNAELRIEMDAVIKKMSIENQEEMWSEMDKAIGKILMKYANVKEP